MAALNFNALFFNHEIPFCKVYGMESKDKLEKLLVTNRISFFYRMAGETAVGAVVPGGSSGEKCFYDSDQRG